MLEFLAILLLLVCEFVFFLLMLFMAYLLRNYREDIIEKIKEHERIIKEALKQK